MSDDTAETVIREASPGGTITVDVGEVFAIRVLDKGAAGYVWTVEPPWGALSHGSSSMRPEDGTIGGFHDVLHLHSVLVEGTHVFGLHEGRPWLDHGERHRITVECVKGVGAG